MFEVILARWEGEEVRVPIGTTSDFGVIEVVIQALREKYQRLQKNPLLAVVAKRNLTILEQALRLEGYINDLECEKDK